MKLKEIADSATIGDKLLFVALIILSLSGFLFIKKAFPQGADVTISMNGTPVYKLPINEDAIVSVKGAIGETVVEIKSRRVRVKESSCPNKICVHNGWIESGGILCLPNKVFINIDRSKEKHTSAIDAISG